MSGRSTSVRAQPYAGEGSVVRTDRVPGLAARWGLERIARGRYELLPLSRATSSSIASSAASSGLVSRLT